MLKFLKVLLPSSILATWPVHLNLMDLVAVNTLDEVATIFLFDFCKLLLQHAVYSFYLFISILFWNSCDV